MKKKRAVLAGEFDPITDFDYSIIQRCSLVFDEVVLLLVNNDRHAFFLPGERLDPLAARADTALYKAKAEGKNTVRKAK